MTTRAQIIEAVAAREKFEVELIEKGPAMNDRFQFRFHIKGECLPIALTAPSLSAFSVDQWVDAIASVHASEFPCSELAN